MASITLAVVPTATPGDSHVALDALCKALGTLVGTEVRAAHPSSYGALTAELEKDRVQYAWMPPALMVLTDEHVQLRPLLSAVRGDRTDFCAALFVDEDRAFQTIDDLHGKTVAWVDPTSAAGYLFPRIHLASCGVDPDHLFGKEVFFGSHPEAIRAVFDGRADVGATYAERPPAGEPIRRAGFMDVAPDRPVRVLEWTRPIPNDVIVGHGLLTKADHRVFSNAILTLGEREDGRQLLYRAFHAERFISTPRNALRPLWELVRLARFHGLLRHL